MSSPRGWSSPGGLATGFTRRTSCTAPSVASSCWGNGTRCSFVREVRTRQDSPFAGSSFPSSSSSARAATWTRPGTDWTPTWPYGIGGPAGAARLWRCRRHTFFGWRGGPTRRSLRATPRSTLGLGGGVHLHQRQDRARGGARGRLRGRLRAQVERRLELIEGYDRGAPAAARGPSSSVPVAGERRRLERASAPPPRSSASWRRCSARGHGARARRGDRIGGRCSPRRASLRAARGHPVARALRRPAPARAETASV